MHLISVHWGMVVWSAVTFMCSKVTFSYYGLEIVSKNTSTTHCASSSGIVTQRYTRPEVVRWCENTVGE